jgi:hypothetical protein
VRFALAALAIAAISTVYWNRSFPLWVRVAVVAVAAGGLARPREALLALAVAGPFSGLALPAAGVAPFRTHEALVLAFLAGWLLRRPPDTPGAVIARLTLPALLFAAVVVSSSAALALELYRMDPVQFADSLASLGWYLWIDDPMGVVAGAALIEGLLLVVAVVELTQERPRLALALINAIGLVAAAAASLTVLLAAGVLPVALTRYAGLPERRFVAHITDLNAAGSYFAMVFGLACGMAAATLGTRRRIWIVAAAALLAALVLTGSRAAVGAALATAAAAGAWTIARRRRLTIPGRAPRTVIAGVVALAAFAVLRTPVLYSSEMRRDFTITSLRMMAERPVLGVGAGRYYPLSRLALTPRLGVLYAEENAHNYFLQIGAELGLAGLAAFLWFFAAALKPAAHTLREASRNAVGAGLLAGAVVFLVTSLAGHPFLVREASVPFWMILGLYAVTSRLSAPPVPYGRWTSHVAIAAAVLLIVSIPFRPGVPRVRLKPQQDGFGPVQTDPDGRRYREMSAFGALFVGPGVTALEIPIRLADANRRGPQMRVIDQEPGWSQHLTLVGADWVVVRLTLPGARPLMPYQRINLNVQHLSGEEPADPSAPVIAVRDVVITNALPPP